MRMTTPTNLKAGELRLRNLIKLQGEVTEVMSMKQTGRGDGWLINAVPDYMYEGIIIDEDILVKCGFEKEYVGYGLMEYRIGKFELIFDGSDFWYNKDAVTLQYLHQLQNLYFALTGEELKIEL